MSHRFALAYYGFITAAFVFGAVAQIFIFTVDPFLRGAAFVFLALCSILSGFMLLGELVWGSKESRES